MRNYLCFAGSVAAVAGLSGCATVRSGAMAGRGLVELDEAWAAAASANNLDVAMEFWADDAVMYVPDMPPLHGKQAIGEHFASRHHKRGDPPLWSPCCAGLDEHASMGYTLGEGAIPVAGDSGAFRKGRYVAIWRWDTLRWRCAVKCWATSP